MNVDAQIRDYLAETYGAALGKAKVTGYCIKFGSLGNVDLAVLEAAIRDGIARTSGAAETHIPVDSAKRPAVGGHDPRK